MGVLGDPFKLFVKLLLVTFKIPGYTVIFIIQTLWYISHARTDKIGDAFGDFGRSVIDAIGDVFR